MWTQGRLARIFSVNSFRLAQPRVPWPSGNKMVKPQMPPFCLWIHRLRERRIFASLCREFKLRLSRRQGASNPFFEADFCLPPEFMDSADIQQLPRRAVLPRGVKDKFAIEILDPCHKLG